MPFSPRQDRATPADRSFLRTLIQRGRARSQAARARWRRIMFGHPKLPFGEAAAVEHEREEARARADRVQADLELRHLAARAGNPSRAG